MEKRIIEDWLRRRYTNWPQEKISNITEMVANSFEKYYETGNKDEFFSEIFDLARKEKLIGAENAPREIYFYMTSQFFRDRRPESPAGNVKKNSQTKEYGELEIVAYLVDEGGKKLTVAPTGRKKKEVDIICHATIVNFEPDYGKIDTDYPQIVGKVTAFTVQYPTGKYKFFLMAEYNSPHYGLLRSDQRVPYTVAIKKGKKSKIEINMPVPPAAGGGGGGIEGVLRVEPDKIKIEGPGPLKVTGEIKGPSEPIKFEPAKLDATMHADVDVHVHGGGSGELWCPSCLSFSSEKYPLHQMAGSPNLYHCNHCDQEFILKPTGELIPVHPYQEIPEKCPYCKKWVDFTMVNTPQGGKVYRLYCSNRSCERGGYSKQPWFVDLSERDYNQWKEVRKKKMEAEIDQLEDWLDTHVPLTNSRFIQRRKDEIRRAKEHVKNFGTVKLDGDRLIPEKKDLVIAKAVLAAHAYGINLSRDAKADDVLEALGHPKEDVERFSEEERKEFGEKSPLINEEMAKKLSEEEYERQQKERLLFNKIPGVGKEASKYGPKRVGNWLSGFGKYGTKSSFSVVLALIGIITGALLGWPFLVAFAAWAARNMIPDPKPTKLVDDWRESRWGSMGVEQENKYAAGLAVMKSLLKLTVLIFLGIGFFTTDLPFRGFVLLAFCFLSYFSLPGEYDIKEPQKFIEGILRIPLAIFLAFVVFWGIFGSSELAWLTMAFFAVFPVATSDRAGLARAIGQAGSGVASTFESFDKIIFAILMFIGLWSVMGGAGLNLEIGTLVGNVFVWFWIISLVGGLTSPSQVRPYTGIIMLVMVFIFYSSGVGEQIVGQGFFGAWWPTVHNGITSITKPIGEAFASVQGTFGQTFLLLTNPVAFSKQIMEGSYVKNPTGPTGAYGLEIENLVVPAIYPGTYAMATFNIKNAGPVKAKNVSVRISVPADFKNALKIQNMKMEEKEVDEYSIVDKNDIMPVFFILNGKNCKEIENMPGWYDRLKKRNEYIRVNISVEYEYEVSSWMPLTIISPQEWKDRTSKGTFAPAKVGSFITTSPAKLSIGSFDQPLIGGARPFYLGFNLTPGEPGEIDWTWEGTKIVLNYSSELENGITRVCNPKPTNDAPPLTWTKLPKYQAVFCTFTSTPDPQDPNKIAQGPSKTYYITASASFRFKKTETKDTLFAFSDVCGGQGIPAPPEGVELGPDDIKNVVVNVDSATNRVTVTWDTTLTSFSEVLYKRQSDSDSVPFVSKKDTSLTKTHQMVLEGLDAGLVPNAVYMLKVKSGGREKDGGTFKTGECNILNKETCVKYSAYCEWKYDNTPQAVCQPKNQ